MARLNLLSLILLPALIFAVGCGADSDPIPVPTEELPATDLADSGPAPEYDPFEGEPIRPHIAFIAGGDSAFWKLAGAGVMDAGKELDLKVDVRFPTDGKPEEQVAFAREMMRDGCSAIAVGPVDPANQDKWINRIVNMIELVTLCDDAPASDRMMYIGTDDYAAGRACGELLKTSLPEGGSVVLMIDDLNRDKSRLRRQGVIDVLIDRQRDLAFYQGETASWDEPTKPIKGERFTILGTVVDNGDAQVAREKASKLIGKVADLGGVVGLTEASVPVCLSVLKDADKLGDVKVVGFGSSQDALTAIAEGQCVGIIAEDGYEYGSESVKRLYRILGLVKGAIPESKKLSIPFKTVSQDNVQAFSADMKEKLSSAEQAKADAS